MKPDTRQPPEGRTWPVRVAGMALIAFLLFLLVLTGLSQRDFRESYLAQQRLDLETRASALAYFYHERMKDLRALAVDPGVETYFANAALGMSMEYGLRASLIRFERTLRERATAEGLEGQPAFSRIAFVTPDREALVDTSTDGEPFWLEVDLGLDQPASSTPKVVTTNGYVLLVLDHQHGLRPQGWFIGRVDHEKIFASLVHDPSIPSVTRVYTLVDGAVMSSREEPPDEIVRHVGGLNGGVEESGTSSASRSGSMLVSADVESTPFTLLAVHQPSALTGYLTSHWLLALLALLSILLVIGIGYANWIQRQSLVLRGRVEESARQEAILSDQNTRLIEEMRKREAYEQQLTVQANFDGLTGLPNRSLAFDRLSQVLLMQRRHDDYVAVVLLDLDRFKKVNDSLGHNSGDKLLIAAAQRLRALLRESDTVARLGGDEFLVILPGLERTGIAEKVCRKIQEEFSVPLAVGKHEFIVSASLGISIAPDDGHDAETLLKNADIALYRAKDQGRNTYRFFTREMNEALEQRQKMEDLLIYALARDEFSLVFQPIVKLDDGSIVGAEALLRWCSPELGVVAPSEFIPLCEDLGIIGEIGAWVLSRACGEAGRWRKRIPFRLAVNISSVQFRDPYRFIRLVEAELAKSGLPPQDLHLEITEGILLEDSAANWAMLKELDAMGVRLSIDDFGTGYSSLSYLRRFPFDTLKIDKSFVGDLPNDTGSVALARAILALARALRMDVVAEGIENAEQAAFFRSQRCDLGQGYHFYKPMTADALTALIASTPEREPEEHGSAASLGIGGSSAVARGAD